MITKVVCLFIALIAQLPLSESTLRIGIPDSLFPSFVHRESNGNFSGLSIEVFKKSLKLANISSSYKFISFKGTYSELIKNVSLKKFDAAVGDLQILSHRLLEVDFTVPYLASGIVVVVPQKRSAFKTTWMLDVFTKEMWIIIAALHLLISLVTAMIELTDKDDAVDFKKLGGLWLTFISFTERDSPESDVARYIRAVWKLVIAILVACYYANLTSSLTVSKMTPRVPDIGNATVGCNKNSFICRHYLEDVLQVDSGKIKKMSSPSEYIKAFRKSEIEAAYFIKPHARVFLKMYGQEVMEWETPKNLGGLAFAFQKGSPYTLNMSLAISELMENGNMTKLEQTMIDSLHCMDVLDDGPVRKIHASEFWSLLMVSAIGLTIGFLVVAKRLVSKRYSAVDLSPSFKYVSDVKC